MSWYAMVFGLGIIAISHNLRNVYIGVKIVSQYIFVIARGGIIAIDVVIFYSVFVTLL